MTEKIGCLVVDLQGTTVTPEEKEILAHPLVGGVILFSRNYESKAQLKALCQGIRTAQASPRLLMVDQEGGRVQRFITEFTRLPPLDALGQLYDQKAESALPLIKDAAWLMANELLALGLDLSLAPVIDINKGLGTVIGNRAFHRNPRIVSELATTYMQGMREAGMAATAKHFPGHGSVAMDSHLNLPVDERSYEVIEQADLLPFIHLIQVGLPAVMAAHILFPAVDAQPVGYSSKWLKTILRERLGFKGTILSDDLNMGGANISSDYADRASLAREAGCDFVLLCNNRSGVIQVLDRLSSQSHCVTKDKWAPLVAMKKDRTHIFDSTRWQTTHAFLEDNLHASISGETP